MRILVVGAGAIGGYFGGRLHEKGEDVTFLVRERRKAQIEANGLRIKSAKGGLEFTPKLITAADEAEPFDVILLSVKSYHLEGAIRDARAFAVKDTIVLPLLNGIAHVDRLAGAFGEEAVIGGLCFIETTLDKDGTIVHTSPVDQLIYGERNGEETDRMAALKKVFEGTKAGFRWSSEIVREMWHKYLFITTMSGVTTAMAAPIGPILAFPTGERTVERQLHEVESVMRALEAPIAEGAAAEQFARIKGLKPGMKSSMQRDAEKSMPLEAAHLQGYLLERAQELNVMTPVLDAIYTKLELYEKSLN